MIGNNIKTIRENKGIKLSALAGMIGISPGYLSDIEKGNKQNPSMEILNNISKALGVSLGDIVISPTKSFSIELMVAIQKAYSANLHDGPIKNLDFLQLLSSELNIDYDNLFNVYSDDSLELSNLEQRKLLQYFKDINHNLYDEFIKDEYINIPNELNNIAKEPSSKYRVNNTNAPEAIVTSQFDFVKIPIVGVIRAGQPIFATENIEDYIPLPHFMVSENGEYFGLKVKGDSMNLEFKEGTILIVEKTDFIENGEIGIVLINGFDATVKKIVKNQNMITLIPMSSNQIYTPTMYDIVKDEIKIIGKVKHSIKTY